MAIKLTGNYGLKKPEQDEFFDVGHQNGNMDVIDGAIKENADGISKLNQAATKTEKGLMSPADKAKLDGIEDKANNYIHPINSGNKHMPAGGTAGQILQNTADGTAIWQDLEAAETRVSETVRALYGLTGENANVDKALGQVWNKVDRKLDILTYITTSGNWTASKNGYIDVFIAGAGGGGTHGEKGGGGPQSENYVKQTGSIGGNGGCGGGGGNSLLIKGIKVTTGQVFTTVIGVGGAPDTNSNGAKDGGATSFGPYVAYGGKGAKILITNGTMSDGANGLSGGGGGGSQFNTGPGADGVAGGLGGSNGMDGQPGGRATDYMYNRGLGGKGEISILGESLKSGNTLGYCPLDGKIYGNGGAGGCSGGNGGDSGTKSYGADSPVGAVGQKGGNSPKGGVGGNGGNPATVVGPSSPGQNGINGGGGGGAGGVKTGATETPRTKGGNGGNGPAVPAAERTNGGNGGNGGGGAGGSSSYDQWPAPQGHSIGGNGSNGTKGGDGLVIICYRG